MYHSHVVVAWMNVTMRTSASVILHATGSIVTPRVIVRPHHGQAPSFHFGPFFGYK